MPATDIAWAAPAEIMQLTTLYRLFNCMVLDGSFPGYISGWHLYLCHTVVVNGIAGRPVVKGSCIAGRPIVKGSGGLL